MCGICGIYGTVDTARLRDMNGLLTHRGPDSEGYYVDPEYPVGLAMRRLSIIDLETGSQPIFNEDRTMAVVLNGEIYNYRTLASQLAGRGHRFASHSDTEVIVHAYEEYGADAVDHLDGMFSFALWDRRKETLFCARDRLGIKPFYYCHRGDSFLFASEQKPILKALQDKPDIDRMSLMRHLLIGFYTGPYSMFKEIRQLPPGSTLTFTHGHLAIRRYWRLAGQPSSHPEGEREGMEHLREDLQKAVGSHMVSDVPVGLTLSGGLDSSIIALLMTEHVHAQKETPLHAYTVGYGDQSDEIPFARMMTDALPLTAHEKVYRPEEAIEALPAIVWHLEEPLSNITAVTAYHWAKFMAPDLKVTLIGEGADEAMGGYFQYRLFTDACSLMPTAVGSRLFRYACLQPPLGLVTALMGGCREVASEVRHIYHDEYLAPFAADGGGLRAALRFDLEHQLPNNQLLRVDRMTMAHSLEARVPYLCHHLVESAWAYPDDWKIRGTVQKYLLRKAYEDRLATEIIQRPKIGRKGSQAIFPILFRAGLFRFMEHILLNSKASHAWFDRRVVKELLERKRGVYPILGSRVRDKLLYAMFLFVIWHMLFMEKRVFAKGDVPSLTDLAGL